MLPIQYQRVEYLQSSGTQYIDTGFACNQNTKVDAIVNILASSKIAGAMANTSKSFTCTINVTNKNYNIRFGNNNISYSDRKLYSAGEHIIEVSKNGCYIDGELEVNFPDQTSWQADDNLYLFRLNGTTSNNPSFKMKEFKLYDNEILIRNFIPCYRISDSKPGMYDLVNDVFYTNAATSDDDFVVGPDVYKRLYPTVNKSVYYLTRLPAGYQEIEYMERPKHTSQIYINTGVATSLNLELEAIYCYTTAASDGETTVCSSGSNTTDGIVMAYWSSGPSHAFRFGNKEYYPTAGFNIIKNKYYHVILNKTNVTVDGAVKGTFNATSTITDNIYIGYDIWTGTSNRGPFRLKYFKITDGETVVREFIPCIKLSTNKVGLYDLINGEFYSNALESATVDFIAGPDVGYKTITKKCYYINADSDENKIKKINKTIYYREVEVD